MIKKGILIVVSVLGLLTTCHSQNAQSRPNILWIMIEDWSQNLSCYGTKGVYTPNIDQLAKEGERFTNSFTTSPVCSTSRSAMMTGFYQNYIGANQHRTYKKVPLPYGIKPIPKLLEEAGYFTSLMSWKVDCNFLPDKKEELFMDTSDYTKKNQIGWRNRKKGQPFFASITFQDTHRPWDRDSIRPINLNDVVVPPYYANTDLVKRDWANGLEQVQIVDRQIGILLDLLKKDGLADNTLVFFISDHGGCHIRGKQFLYDEGIKIPMIMKWPGKIKPNVVNDDMVMSIDICATILEAAGVKEPVPLHGKSLFSKEVKDRKYIFAARDQMDETHDAMRAVRSKKYKLIHNLMPERPYLQFNSYKEGAYPVLAEMNVLHLEGKLTKEQDQFFSATKPVFELYDIEKDPYELRNLADVASYKVIKEDLIKVLNNWRQNVIKDKGISEDFKANGIFPDKCPTPTVDEWVVKNKDNYDFEKYGWPSWYPTKTLEEWKRVKQIWVPYVYREANNHMKRPQVSLSDSKEH
ncbi:sulfatase [Flavobacterium ovatum]|uniref:sulfatase family protein n=1 Tax=Flavobacterium ovatum TaxID=1928857 RepID=UPI00344D105D